MFDKNEITRLIVNSLPGAEVIIASDDGVHFAATVTARQFAGKNMLQQHRLVYAALGDKMGGDIHALSIKTKVLNEGE